jgi:hypothetical protein
LNHTASVEEGNRKLTSGRGNPTLSFLKISSMQFSIISDCESVSLGVYSQNEVSDCRGYFFKRHSRFFVAYPIRSCARSQARSKEPFGRATSNGARIHMAALMFNIFSQSNNQDFVCHLDFGF